MKAIRNCVLIVVSVSSVLYGCSSNLMDLGRFYEQRGDYSTAAESYENARLQGESGTDVAIRLADIYTKVGEYGKAIEEFESARQVLEEVDPAYAYISYKLGYCHYEMGHARSAIRELERAVELNSELGEAHLYLGAIYLRQEKYSQAVKEFKGFLERENTPRARYYLATSYWGQGTYEALEAALVHLRTAEREETDEHWRQTYRELRVAIEDRIGEISQRIVGLELQERIFPSVYELYSRHPIGTLIIQNKPDQTMYHVEIDVDVKGHGVFPQKLPFRDISPERKRQRIELFANFTDKILRTPYHNQTVEVKLTYDVFGVDGVRSEKTESTIGTLVLHDKNDMTWGKPYSGMISAFVTHIDNSVESFTKAVVSAQRPFENAIEVYNALDLYGIKYSSDASPARGQIDRIFYPRETLELKRGDCDDLSVLYAACLENVGVETAFILAPGHVFVMFDTGVHLKNAGDLFLGSDWYIETAGSRHAWIPVETTLLGQEGRDFLDAWAQGIRQYRSLIAGADLQEVVYTHDAWDSYKPVVFPDRAPPPQVPSPEHLRKKNIDTLAKIDGKRQSLLKKKIQKYHRELEISPQNAALHNSFGIVYGKFSMVSPDYLKRSEKHFRKAMLLEDSLPAPRTNLGNILLLGSRGEEDLNKAEERYEEAIQRGETEGVYVNKMILHIVQGNRQKATYSLAMALRSYTFEEVQTILGQSMEDFGMAKGRGKERTNKIRELIQSLLRKLKDAEPKQEVEKHAQSTVDRGGGKSGDIGKSVEPSSPGVAEIDQIMGELRDILGDTVPREPDGAISPGGVRGAITQLGKLPLLLYWSDVRID